MYSLYNMIVYHFCVSVVESKCESHQEKKGIGSVAGNGHLSFRLCFDVVFYHVILKATTTVELRISRRSIKRKWFGVSSVRLKLPSKTCLSSKYMCLPGMDFHDVWGYSVTSN